MLNMNELKKLSKEELSKKVVDLRKELFDIKLKKNLATLENSADLKKIRRDIARVLTAINSVEAK
jgi:large subunit ribosomal protein L29